MLTPTEDELAVVEAVRRFAESRLTEAAPIWDRQAALPSELGPELAELGLTAMGLEEARGGVGFGPEVVLGAVVELARADASLAWVVGAHNLALGAAREPPNVDAAVAGRTWLTIGGPTPAPGTGAVGVALGAGPTHVVAGPDAVIPTDALDLGEPAALGLRAARLVSVADARLRLVPSLRAAALDLAAAVAIGAGEAASDAALAYAREREQFGRPIGDFQGLQFRIADRATELEAARTLLRWSARSGGLDRARRAALLAARAATAAAYDAIQVLGGVGFVREYPVERRYRDAQALEGLLLRPRALRLELGDAALAPDPSDARGQKTR